MIPCGQPDTGPLERQYLIEAIEANELSKGKALRDFEGALCSWTKHRYAIGVSSGTDALTIALRAHGVGPGCKVAVPSLTFAAVAAAAVHAGATPVFVGCGPDGCMCPEDLSGAAQLGLDAIVAVHAYGNRADIEALAAVAPGVPIIVDASQGHGLLTPGGYTEIMSFHGNKVLTCGEGGAIVADDTAVAVKCRHLATHAQKDLQAFWHDDIGYNAKLTNIQAAVGLAQLHRWEEIEASRLRVARRYEANLKGSTYPVFRYETPWLVSVMADNRAQIMNRLQASAIEHRAWFPLIHTMPPYETFPNFTNGWDHSLSNRGLSLPTFGKMKNCQIDRVCEVVLSCE